MGTVAYIDHTDQANAAQVALIETDADRGAPATQTLTMAVLPSVGETITLGAQVYTFEALGALTDVPGHVELGADLATTQTHVRDAVQHTGTPGVGYAASTPVHPDVVMSAFTANVATVTARVGGPEGNAIVTTDTLAAPGDGFGGATLVGGTTVPMAVVYRNPAAFLPYDADPLELVYALDASTEVLAACTAVGATVRSIDALA